MAPVKKVVVTNRPHCRRNNGVDLVSGVSALLAWFPASWASKIAPCFIGEEGGSIQVLQEVAIVCPHREFEGLQRDAVDQVLQAVKFTDKNVPGLSLALDEEFQAANCFTELIRGYTMGVVEPYIMMGLQPTGPTRVNLEVIVPSPTGLTPAKWKQTATLCPLDWPSNYSLLRLWHMLHSSSSKYNIVICLLTGKSTVRSWRVECSSSNQPIMCQKRSLGNTYKNGSSLIGDYEENTSFFFCSAPVAFRRVALETPEWTSRDSNHHRQSVSAGKTNAIPTEPSGRLYEENTSN